MKVMYWYLNDCCVCSADEVRVAELAAQYDIPFEKKDIQANLAEASQRLIFVAPTVTLMMGDKEVHRQARIIDFLSLQKQLERGRDADH